MPAGRVLLAGLLALACSEDGGTEPPPPPPPPPSGVALQLVVSGLSQPLYVTAAPGDEARLFVVEKTGAVRIVRNGVLVGRPFLDLSDSVTTNGERGLLGFAFHPEYATNGRFFVHYTDLAGDTRVVRYAVSTDPDSAAAGSGVHLLFVDQPFDNHNGGWIGFGPDGYLYVALGDGGSAGDPRRNGQSLGTLLGKILRLDVDGGNPYAVPSDNPFVGVAGAGGEIWAYGLRNPWRASFDRQTGDLYIGDVGQGAWEEVDVQPGASGGGENYGWSVMEGAHCFGLLTCNTAGKVLPVYEYPTGDGCAITGGYVYRGSAVPALAGRYVFADFCRGFVRSFRLEGGQAADIVDHTTALSPPTNLASFGEDARGELYIASLNGTVHRFVAAP